MDSILIIANKKGPLWLIIHSMFIKKIKNFFLKRLFLTHVCCITLYLCVTGLVTSFLKSSEHPSDHCFKFSIGHATYI